MKLLTSKLLTSLAIALLLLPLSAAGLVQAQVADPVAVKNAFDAALNAHDVERALATFAPDARFTTPGGNVLTGALQIRAYLQELVAQNYHADVLETRLTAPDTVFSRGTIGLDQFRRLGLASVEATAEVVVQGGRIVSFTSALTPVAAARIQAAQNAQATGARLPRTGQANTPFAVAWVMPWLALGFALTCVSTTAGRSRWTLSGRRRSRSRLSGWSRATCASSPFEDEKVVFGTKAIGADGSLS